MNGITHNESDITLRLVEVWYDITWAYYMSSSHGDHVARRMDKRRRKGQGLFSSSASVATVATTKTMVDDSVSGKSLREKLQSLDKGLRAVKMHMRARQFEDICRVSLKSHDDLYPGFQDVLPIVQSMLRESSEYTGQLTAEEIHGLTLTLVFQCAFYQLCTFLLEHPKGRVACKFVCTPTKISHATYDICRQKFCQLLCDESSIVQSGLRDAIHRVQRDRDNNDDKTADDVSSMQTQPPWAGDDAASSDDRDDHEDKEIEGGNASSVDVDKDRDSSAMSEADDVRIVNLDTLALDSYPDPGPDPIPDLDPDPSPETVDVPPTDAHGGPASGAGDNASVAMSIAASSTPVQLRRSLRRRASIRFPVVPLSSDSDNDDDADDDSDSSSDASSHDIA